MGNYQKKTYLGDLKIKFKAAFVCRTGYMLDKTSFVQQQVS